MGVDFLKSKCKPFEKAWDAEEVSKRSASVPSKLVAKTRGHNDLHEGDEVLLRAHGDQLTLLVEVGPATVLVDPAPAMVAAILESGGYANGRIEAADPTIDLLKIQVQ